MRKSKKQTNTTETPVPVPVQDLRGDIIRMRDIIGEKSFKKLLSGKEVLNIWYRSSPSNWFISPSVNSGKFSWHSDTETPRKLPKLSLFVKVDESIHKVSEGFAWERINVRSEHETYKLKDEVINYVKENKL